MVRLCGKRELGSVNDFIVDGDHFTGSIRTIVLALTTDGGVTLRDAKLSAAPFADLPVLYNGDLVVGDSEGYLHSGLMLMTGAYVAQQK